MTDSANVFRACYAAYLANDWDAMGRLLTDDVVLESPGQPPVVGRAAVLASHQQTKRTIPDIGGEYSEIVAAGDVVGGRKLVVGTNTGAILTSGHELPPTGRTIRLPESDWMRVEDGRCAHHWIYYDRMLLLEQLGLMPARPPAQA